MIAKSFFHVIDYCFFQQVLKHVILVEHFADQLKVDSQVRSALFFLFELVEAFPRGIFLGTRVFSFCELALFTAVFRIQVSHDFSVMREFRVVMELGAVD